jgi:DNA-binding transcriptional MerR regulator
MTGVQPYVLRSWEREFPGIGLQKSDGSPRLYRASDVEQIQRIRQLVVGEGLTLAGARRRLEESGAMAPERREEEIADVLESLGADARARIATVRNGLRTILEVLSRTPGAMPVPSLTFATAGAPASRRNGSAGAAKARAKGRSAAKRVVATKRSGVARKPSRIARRSS